MILKCVKVVAAAAFALVSLNVSGQDLLARQAPIDRKLKAVDSVALIRQIKAEKSAYPAYMQDKLTFPPLSDESMQQNLLLSIFGR